MINRLITYINYRRKKKRLLASFNEIKKLESKTNKRFSLSISEMIPVLDEDTLNTEFDRHYIYHPAWAIRKVKEINPSEHIDISSTLHFCSMLSAFYKVKFYDYRPVNLVLSQLECGYQDLTCLSFENNSIHSLSCMHTVEHIGLGRYGDKIDYDGDLKAMKELTRVLAIKGNLLFVVPIGGIASIQFNAHRIYTKDLIISHFIDLGLSLKEFVLIPENEKDGALLINPYDQLIKTQSYGCGCFWFTKEQ